MRGFPPLHLFFFSLLFGLIAWPLSQLTFARRAYQPVATVEAVPQPDAKPSSTSAFLTLRISHPPSQLIITPLHPGDAKPMFKLKDHEFSNSPIEIPVEISLDENTLEISIEASWPSATPDAALTVELEPDGFDRKSHTVWSNDQQLNEILTFQWKP